MKIYDGEIESMVQKIREENFIMTYETNNFDISFIRSLVFDQNSQFLIGIGLTQLLIIDMNEEYSEHDPQIFKLDPTLYEQIYSVQFRSSLDNTY